MYKLDLTSERYRICPECQTAFMANHLSQLFCDRKCANDYNNRKKRLAKSAKDMLRGETITIEIPLNKDGDVQQMEMGEISIVNNIPDKNYSNAKTQVQFIKPAEENSIIKALEGINKLLSAGQQNHRPIAEKAPIETNNKEPSEISNRSMQERKQRTIQFLSTLLGNETSVETDWEKLPEEVDLKAYDTVELLPHCKLKKANYGNYSVVWVSAEKLLITNQKNLLWTSI